MGLVRNQQKSQFDDGICRQVSEQTVGLVRYQRVNPNLTMEYVEKHPDKPWNWEKISTRHDLTMQYVGEHAEKPWDWIQISCNPIVTLEYIGEHPDAPWN